jgi:hypothetical protein
MHTCYLPVTHTTHTPHTCPGTPPHTTHISHTYTSRRTQHIPTTCVPHTQCTHTLHIHTTRRPSTCNMHSTYTPHTAHKQTYNPHINTIHTGAHSTLTPHVYCKHTCIHHSPHSHTHHKCTTRYTLVTHLPCSHTYMKAHQIHASHTHTHTHTHARAHTTYNCCSSFQCSAVEGPCPKSCEDSVSSSHVKRRVEVQPPIHPLPQAFPNVPFPPLSCWAPQGTSFHPTEAHLPKRTRGQ